MSGRTRHIVTSIAVGALVGGAGLSSPLFGADPPAPGGSLRQVDTAHEGLAADIDEILADSRLDGAQAAVVVRDAETGETVYEHEPDQRFMPASNAKLLTSAVALDVLGPEHTFTTTVATTGRRSGTVLRGDLHLRGGGDPTMLAEDYAALAEQVADAGVRTIVGDVVADDSRYDDVRLGNDWNWNDEPYYYAAPVSALTVAPNTDYDAGTVIVDVDPAAEPGARPDVTVVPETDSVTVVNEATTAPAGDGSGIRVGREHGTDVITVTGSIAVDAGGSRDWVSVWEPTEYAADVFVRQLRRNGVRVLGGAAEGVTPDGARRIAAHESMPLRELMVPFMKLSNNGHAEVLIKEMGRVVAGEGSWDAGLDVLRDELATGYGLDVDTMSNRDGSGLSRRNLIPPEQIATLLEEVQDRPWFDEWHESLPIAGESERMVGGTLRSRMDGTAADGNVHAKTGTLTGATALSGYVTDADGRRLIFSVMFNDYLSDKPSDLEDRIAVRLAEYSQDAATLRRPAAEVPAVDLPGNVECSWVKAC
ncbi:D-alanyl-D-alanine carboxypeptidase/D-alanyl-D-alanine-endopeptidase (penicillin-binding protein 4) [Haloactinopolyspora alba]|uniref:D-alanyl-D-alanine carboxypeptidase/D-alanyl-D-alanine-endopeptidase (Penicillin-binding protein 4) n=1 Tax=Haloactinopolyspora alba TaxID=648780 RepID=A0A2P8EBW5_9ACTN|nr:D-alanyl-D-alanine carboxypeptidase/D-alanyl-D-alanine-endopeptidase [Haloactinopolyspora alba]PSL06944.1 D-alanyl-D-alanine carboxypeptidase/D-alanyl-D-alanine-endopeptidase (penicillin-binding protein 4) [Haloactinopolyspora alba]